MPASGDSAAGAGARAPRAVCARCLRAQAACICHWITPLASGIELLILQHPLEVDHAKNSARLLHLSVAPSVLLVGEAFDAPALGAALGAGGRTSVLLYPDTPGDAARAMAAPAPLAPAGLAQLAARGRLRLVLLDATWRKSRKMLYQNPLLQALPRLALRAMAPSHYRIRKAHAPDQLSTLEAAAHACLQLGADPAPWHGLFQAFDGFVAQQLAFVPLQQARAGRQAKT